VSAQPQPEIKGWTWAGFVPFGLFAFANGSVGWGLIGLASTFSGLIGVIYWVFIGLQGRELAWKGRRYQRSYDFERSMHQWDLAGQISAMVVLLSVLALAIFFAIKRSEHLI
jgi:hypothetical protein